jgi:hypothetical protein
VLRFGRCGSTIGFWWQLADALPSARNARGFGPRIPKLGAASISVTRNVDVCDTPLIVATKVRTLRSSSRAGGHGEMVPDSQARESTLATS